MEESSGWTGLFSDALDNAVPDFIEDRVSQAMHAIADDPWGTLAMAGVVVIGTTLIVTGVAAPIGAGILIGAGFAAGFGLATGRFNPREVALGGVFGGAMAGVGPAAAFGLGAAESVAHQTLIEGQSLDDISAGQVLFSATLSAVFAGAGRSSNLGDDVAEATQSIAGRAASGCNSFVPGTQVLMADHTTKPIEDVQLGDLVWATDPETGESGPRPVIGTIAGTGEKDLVDLTIDNEVITATESHPIWITNRGEWVDAEDVRSGDLLLDDSGVSLVVDAVDVHPETSAAVHNFNVEGFHTYYVTVAGGASFLVHNSLICPEDPGLYAEVLAAAEVVATTPGDNRAVVAGIRYLNGETQIGYSQTLQLGNGHLRDLKDYVRDRMPGFRIAGQCGEWDCADWAWGDGQVLFGDRLEGATMIAVATGKGDNSYLLGDLVRACPACRVLREALGYDQIEPLG